jgi:hypothetical protein
MEFSSKVLDNTVLDHTYYDLPSYNSVYAEI